MNNRNNSICGKIFPGLILAFLLCHFNGNVLYAQEVEFFTTFADAGGNSISPFDICETPEGDVLILVNQDKGPVAEIVKIDNQGVVVDRLEIAKADTTVSLAHIYPVVSGNEMSYIVFGVCKGYNINTCLLTMHINSDLDICLKELVAVPFDRQDIYLMSLLPWKGDFVASFTCYTKYSAPWKTYLSKISARGEILAYSPCNYDSLSIVTNIFKMDDDDTEIGMLAKTSNSSNAHGGVLVFDDDLSLKRRHYFGPWRSVIGGDNYLGYMYTEYGMMERLSSGEYVISSRFPELVVTKTGDVLKNETSSALVRVGEDFAIDTDNLPFMTGHLNDSVEIPAWLKSIAFTDEGDIFQCSAGNDYHYGYQKDLFVIITKMDSNLNVKWQKRFLRDGGSYEPYCIIATNDGGCLVTGVLYNGQLNDTFDVYCLKVSGDDSSTDESIDTNSLSIQPNPTKGVITVMGENFEKAVIYDMLGRCVLMKSCIGKESLTLDLTTFPGGLYFVGAIDRQGRHYVQKIVKE